MVHEDREPIPAVQHLVGWIGFFGLLVVVVLLLAALLMDIAPSPGWWRAFIPAVLVTGWAYRVSAVPDGYLARTAPVVLFVAALALLGWIAWGTFEPTVFAAILAAELAVLLVAVIPKARERTLDALQWVADKVSALNFFMGVFALVLWPLAKLTEWLTGHELSDWAVVLAATALAVITMYRVRRSSAAGEQSDGSARSDSEAPSRSPF